MLTTILSNYPVPLRDFVIAFSDSSDIMYYYTYMYKTCSYLFSIMFFFVVLQYIDLLFCSPPVVAMANSKLLSSALLRRLLLLCGDARARSVPFGDVIIMSSSPEKYQVKKRNIYIYFF